MLQQGVEAARHLELAWPCACPKWPKSLQRASEESCSCRSFWFCLSLMPVFGQPRHRAPQLVSGSSGPLHNSPVLLALQPHPAYLAVVLQSGQTCSRGPPGIHLGPYAGQCITGVQEYPTHWPQVHRCLGSADDGLIFCICGLRRCFSPPSFCKK